MCTGRLAGQACPLQAAHTSLVCCSVLSLFLHGQIKGAARTTRVGFSFILFFFYNKVLITSTDIWGQLCILSKAQSQIRQALI